MMDFYSIQRFAKDRQAELLEAAGRGIPRRSADRGRRRTALAARVLSRLGRALVAIGRQLECLDSSSPHGCVEHTPARI